MQHKIYRVTKFEITGPYEIRVWFDDETSQQIEFLPILRGEMFGPLRNLELFNQVRLDSEVHTLVWPNDADFDPATLHDWSELLPEITAAAKKWDLVAA